MSQLDHALLFSSLLLYHFFIVWFSHHRAYVFAESVGRARPPALPWFVWVGAITSIPVVYVALVVSTRHTGVDTSWFFLVAVALISSSWDPRDRPTRPWCSTPWLSRGRRVRVLRAELEQLREDARRTSNP